jgi:hypothetical protein
MKTSAFFPTLFFLFVVTGNMHAQMRFFQTATQSPGDNWLDSSFVVAASDPALLAEIDLELSKPVNERRHINGTIQAGNGGFNHNAGFWFSWHMPPNSWGLADFSIEVCDGRPFTDVESDTAYWLHNVGQFCPWSSYIAREISAPITSISEPEWPAAVAFLPIYPNPANDEMIVRWELSRQTKVMLSLTDAVGRMTLNLPMGMQDSGPWTKNIQTGSLADGLYYVTLRTDNQILTQQIVIQH